MHYYNITQIRETHTLPFSETEISVLHTTERKFLKELIAVLDTTNYDHYTSRIKTNDSIENKLLQRNLPVNVKNATQHLTDIIGVRIITQYIHEIYDLVRIIREHYEIIEELDYIANPKESGYRSYHMVINIPIVNNNFTFPYADHVAVEIQIRTMGMDFWASLEHSLVYNRQKQFNITSDKTPMNLIHHELLNYAEAIFSIDMRIQALQQLTTNDTERS